MSKRSRKLKERMRRIRLDPSNASIHRAHRAGEVVDGHLVMHNGLRVKPMDPCYMQLLESNGGCHEPQEEMVFQEVLKHIARGGCMIELGAYWGFYSMWFAKDVPGARCLLVEPLQEHLEVGEYNFAKNGLAASFFCNKVGNGHLKVDQFIADQGLGCVDVLHADIQGKEYQMLCGADRSLTSGRIHYLFVGTHSQSLHYRCKHYLEQRDYVIIADADVDHGSYCTDGVLVARHRAIDGVEPMSIPLRELHRPYTLLQESFNLRRWIARGFSRVLPSRMGA